jgi:hypothetical protein
MNQKRGKDAYRNGPQPRPHVQGGSVEAVQVTDWVQQEITGGGGARWEQWEGEEKQLG